MHTKLCQMPNCGQPAQTIVFRFCEKHQEAWKTSPEAAALEKGAYLAPDAIEHSPLLSAYTDFVNRYSRENK